MDANLSLSALGTRLASLDARAQELRAEMERVAGQFGLLSQELLIVHEAMKLTLADLNGGVYPPRLPEFDCPALNHVG